MGIGNLVVNSWSAMMVQGGHGVRPAGMNKRREHVLFCP